MKPVFFSCLIITLFMGCKKEHAGKVEIYLLNSFTKDMVQINGVPVQFINNAILADQPLVADSDILFYAKGSNTFTLKKDIRPAIMNYSNNTGFAVTVNKEPVYYGVFHPGYLSSLSIGVATIDPVLSINKEIPVRFVLIDGIIELQTLDKRNDIRLLNALRASGRLR